MDGNRSINIANAILILNSLFVSGSARRTCRDAADRNDNRSANVSYGVFGLNFLFGDGAPGNEQLLNADTDTLNYVRIEFCGTELSANNEVNALSIFGVRSGTPIDHAQVKMNLDDQSARPRRVDRRRNDGDDSKAT